MIDFNEAQEIILAHALDLGSQKISVADALGKNLATDIFSPINLPPFNNSAVDGFAVKMAATMTRKISHEVRAVAQEQMPELKEACRIMTGAPIPLGTEAVIMKEDVDVIDSIAHLKRRPFFNENIRFLGEDIKKGELALSLDTRLNPQRLALLLALGISEIDVKTLPKIKIIVTGDELVDPPKPLRFGEVYHLMGPMFLALVKGLGIDASFERVGDDQKAIEHAIIRALDADIILLTGGISMGEHDLVKPALKTLSVQEIFHKGAWRPGKPLFFGRKEKTLIFALPGNPVSAFTCFHVFIRPLIARSLGQDYLPKSSILLKDFEKKPGMTNFIMGVEEENGLHLFDIQGSHRIYGLSKASALIIAPSASAIVKAKESVKYYPI